MTDNRAEASRLESYWRRSKLPVYSLALVLPMLLFYEIGIVYVHRAMKLRYGYRWSVSSDWFIRRLMGGILETLGFSGFFMSGVLIAAVLVVWQIASRRRWEVRVGTLLGMVAESACIALVLALLVVLVLDPYLVAADVRPMSASAYGGLTFQEVVLRVGSGVYEEFVFRFVLMGFLALLVAGALGVKWKMGMPVAILLSAFIFSGSHFIGSGAWPFDWVSFISRTFAGVFFGLVFHLRGFGVAAGGHVLYNLGCNLFYVLLVSSSGGMQ